MLRTSIGLFRGMLTLRRPWLAWIGLLVGANLIAPLFFLETLEGRAVLAALLIGFGIQLAIFQRHGFVRLLGLGHLLVWAPLLPWLWIRLRAAEAGGPLATWLLAVILLDALSLAIDLADVVRYLRGERTASFKLEES